MAKVKLAKICLLDEFSSHPLFLARVRRQFQFSPVVETDYFCQSRRKNFMISQHKGDQVLVMRVAGGKFSHQED
jgi:hypothetical protein